jgi:predicted transport protein
LPEIIDTYTDTWGKMVRLIILKKFYSGKDFLFTLNPDFHDIQFADADSINRIESESESTSNYTELDHLENVSENIKKVYSLLKSKVLELNSELIFNPQRYYVSIREDRNIAFLKVRKKKIRVIIMLPEEQVKNIIKNNSIISLSASVQKFYNGPSCAIDFESAKQVDEIINLLQEKLTNKNTT